MCNRTKSLQRKMEWVRSKSFKLFKHFSRSLSRESERERARARERDRETERARAREREIERQRARACERERDARSKYLSHPIIDIPGITDVHIYTDRKSQIWGSVVQNWHPTNILRRKLAPHQQRGRTEREREREISLPGSKDRFWFRLV
jgi:hypothetical protein